MKPEFEEPKDFEWGNFKNSRGADIRYGRLKADGEAKGTLVITTGFRECIEKYFETVRDLQKEGYDVWIMDWRGQGGSERYPKAGQKAHHNGYDEQIDTLNQFATAIVEKSKGPMMLLAHSMGAHIALRYLKEHEGVFDSAMLTSPMIDIHTNALPKPLARQMAKFAKAGGYLEKYIPGGSDWSDDKHVFKDNTVTSDPERFKVIAEIYARNPDLKIGDPTYGWVYHTFQTIDILNQESYLKSINTKVLMQVSDDDKIVVRGAQERACKLLPNCEKFEIAGSRHEIWMERDELRNKWKAKVVSFMQDRVNEYGRSPKKPKPHIKPKPPGA